MRNIRCNVGFLVFAITASTSVRSLDNDADFRPYYQTRTDISEVASAPIVIPPSQYFEGADGHWSTFNVRVGTPATSVRVIVSTNSPATLVVLPGGCTINAIDPVPVECSNSRGGTFNNTLSRTWIDQGIFGINGVSNGFEANLGYNFDADYGLDSLGLGYADGANGPNLKNQTVAAYALASPLYTGVFGLSTQPVIYQTFGNISVPSFFRSLRNQNLIPSLSWSYTAGAKYRLKAGQFAQLIFGGYDTSRYQPSAVTFSLNADVTRDLIVGVQEILYQGQTTTSLLQDPIYAFVESTDPNIWLPLSACLLFENAFGLVWNETTSMYLINSTQYALLSSANPTVTFSIANTISGGSIVNIQLPIGAFTLRASYPFVDNTTYYFPLKRAASDTQYTLGRTFLQEAYLTVDYDRGNFSINQCTWIDGAASNVVAIRDPLNGISNSSDDNSSSPDKALPKLISPGAIAGIAIGALAIIFILLTVFLLRRRNQHRLIRNSQLIDDNLALTNVQSNYTPNADKKSMTPSEHISLVPSSEQQYFKYQDPKLKGTPYISSILSINEVIHTRNSELDDTERKIYQLSGQSKRPELGNTDTGYRFELAEEQPLPIELSGESIKVEELMSPTLGEEGGFVQLRELGNSKIERPGNFVGIVRARERVTNWDKEWPETPETGVVMGYGPCERNKCGDTVASRGSLNTILRGSDNRSTNCGPGSSDQSPDDFSDAAKSYKTGLI